MADRLEDFQKFRADLNEEILGCGHLGMKRFFALDHQAYEPGPLGTKTKELLGLVASAVLRCDDCITYHLMRCGEEGWKREQVRGAQRGSGRGWFHYHPPRSARVCPHARNQRSQSLRRRMSGARSRTRPVTVFAFSCSADLTRRLILRVVFAIRPTNRAKSVRNYSYGTWLGKQGCRIPGRRDPGAKAESSFGSQVCRAN